MRMQEKQQETVDFGYQQIPKSEKTSRVADVFHSVAHRYDLMNDVMSFGIHRLWKRIAIWHCGLKPGQKVLDLAGGTGDLTQQLARGVGQDGEVYLGDINASMLAEGRKRLLNAGILHPVHYIQINGEALPFANDELDCVVIGFGLRNITDKSLALQEMYRVLKPGGRLVVLEFSKPTSKIIQTTYDAYSFGIIPLLGKLISNDPDSYQYLVESIRNHPDQETLKAIMIEAGFDKVSIQNLTGGIVAIHKGYKY